MTYGPDEGETLPVDERGDEKDDSRHATWAGKELMGEEVP